MSCFSLILYVIFLLSQLSQVRLWEISRRRGFAMAKTLRSSRFQARRQFSAAVGASSWHWRSSVQSRLKSKDSPCALKEVVYASYDDALLERSHQQFTPYKDSKYSYARTGTQKDARTVETLGTLDTGRFHCACSHCKALICGYQNCLGKEIVGASTKRSTRESEALLP